MKKEITLVIPTSILSSDKLNPNDKLVFGLHYAYFKKGQKTYETIVGMSKKLRLHTNIISKSCSKLVKLNYLKKEDGVYFVQKEIIEQLQTQIKGTEEVLLPFELYSMKISSGSKLLWVEYNKYKNKEEGYYSLRKTTAENIGSSTASVTTWKKELYLHNMIEFGEYQSRESIYTVDLRTIQQSKTKEEIVETEIVEEQKPTVEQPIKQNRVLEAINKSKDAKEKKAKTPKKVEKIDWSTYWKDNSMDDELVQ